MYILYICSYLLHASCVVARRLKVCHSQQRETLLSWWAQ